MMTRAAALLLIASSVLTGCSTAPDPTLRSAQNQREFEELIAGKVAGPPVKCLPSYQSNDMVVIDERTIAYRAGSGRVYVNTMRDSCSGLGNSTALITHTFGTPDTCSGDIAEVADLTAHMVVGNCAFGEFVPYVRPGAHRG